MNLLQLFVRDRLFFYSEGAFFKIEGGEFRWVEEAIFEKCKFPLLVVGRENVTESRKRYPVTDKSDLKAIVEQDKGEHSIVLVEEPEENQTFVKFWNVDPELLSRFPLKLFVWIPESILHSSFSENVLCHIERANRKVFSINEKKQNYSVCCSGPFVSEDYFLMSIGASKSDSISVTPNQYAQFLTEAAQGIDSSFIQPVLSAQSFVSRLSQKFNWLSLGLGTVMGVLVFLGSQYFYLDHKISSLEQELSGLEVKKYVARKQSIREKIQAFNEFSGQEIEQPMELQLWKLLGIIMNEGVSVVRIRKPEEGVWLRLSSDVATETLSMIQNLEIVESAKIANAVRNVRGQQRFNMNITFKNTIEVANGGEVNE